MIWDDKMSIEELKATLEKRLERLQTSIKTLSVAVDCYDYDTVIGQFHRVQEHLEDARKLYEVIEDKGLEQAGEELEKLYNELTKEGEE